MTDERSKPEKARTNEPVQNKSTKFDAFKVREPGFNKLKATNLFRTVNFELYARPNKFVMTIGLAAFASCVGYIFYMNMTDDKRTKHYNTMNLDGTLTARERTSKWD